MLGFVLLAIVCATSTTHAEEGEIFVSDNKTQCVNQLVQWCNKTRYPQQGVGLAILSIAYNDPTGSYRVFCSSDSDGTNCTRNGAPWFACTPDHALTYKGRALTSTSTDVDDDICKTADRAFNDLFIQNLSYDNTTLKMEVQKGMEAFFEQIAEMEEHIASIQTMLRKMPSLDDFWGEDDGGVKLRPPRPDLATPASSEKQGIAEKANQIERE